MMNEALLLHDLDGVKRWDIYLEALKTAADNRKSAIILLPDVPSVFKAQEIVVAKFNNSVGILYRAEPKELGEWLKIKKQQVAIVVGTRSSIFAPLDNLGLIIIDEEQAYAYKQDQVPHYHPREVAFMRSKRENAKVILGSSAPTLESIYLIRKAQIKYQFIPRESDFPEIKIIDMKGLRVAFSKYLEDSISQVLSAKGKVLLFLNRRGFATFASCRYCGTVLKCPRCNINLVYHFKGNILSCHYCNFKMPPPNICPNCNSGYIRYSGSGTEAIESELSRLFPAAKIKRIDQQSDFDSTQADIFISTQVILKEKMMPFDLVGVLAIDNSLNHADFRASEHAFALLLEILRLTAKKMVIQTSLPNHYCFQHLQNKNINQFYDEELKQRKQLNLAPYTHLGLVKIRGNKEPRVKEASQNLFNRLIKCRKPKKIEIASLNPGQPAKLRNNFYWNILLKGPSAKEIVRFLKRNLKSTSHSGIIVTVDIDPV